MVLASVVAASVVLASTGVASTGVVSLAGRVPTRPIVSWNAAGDRSSVQPITSPSKATVRTGKPRTAFATSSSRSVTSFRLRVHIRTESSRRWTWMRIPSSFHSTEHRPMSATAEAASSAVEASMGRSGRKIVRPTASSPGRPSTRAMPAVSVRSPISMRARRTAAGDTLAARATASTTTPSLAPWRNSPTSSRRTKSASAAVARLSKPSSRSRRRWTDPAPDASATASSMASRSPTVSVADGAGTV